MNDITQNDLLQMALRNIENAEKQAFVSASVITAPPVDPAADPAAQGAAPQGMPPSGPVGMPQESPAATVAPGTAAPPGAPPEQANSVSGAMPPEAYDQLVAAVRQVMQELGQAPGGSQQAPAGPAEAAQPSQSEKPKGKKGGVDPEEFAKMQAAVAMILEQLGMVSAGEGMLPTQAAPPDAAGTMGASPGVAQNPPPEAQEAPPPLPTGPLDPRASEYMQAAGPAARARASQVGKLAALITGRRPVRIFAQSSMASQPIEASCSVLVVYADNGTPVAVFSTVGNNVAMRTAQSPGFGDTLRILGLKDKAPVVEVGTGPEAPANQG